ncbi:Uncharacterised protein [Mycobacteroides abscessus subsp. abscessus]|nr:Uncharacterised protein [Mycobacteroides abscessus subsp. abscessus]
MTAQSAGHEPMSTSGWQLTPRCYNTSYRVAAFRALIIALILAARSRVSHPGLTAGRHSGHFAHIR